LEGDLPHPKSSSNECVVGFQGRVLFLRAPVYDLDNNLFIFFYPRVSLTSLVIKGNQLAL